MRRVADLRSGAGRKVEPEPEPEAAAAPPSVLHLLTTETHPDLLALVFKNLKGSDLCGISQVPTHPPLTAHPGRAIRFGTTHAHCFNSTFFVRLAFAVMNAVRSSSRYKSWVRGIPGGLLMAVTTALAAVPSQVCSLWAEVAEQLFQSECQQRKWRLTRFPRGSNSCLRWPVREALLPESMLYCHTTSVMDGMRSGVDSV